MNFADWWCCMGVSSMSTIHAQKPPTSSPIICPTAKFKISKVKRSSGQSGSLTGLFRWRWDFTRLAQIVSCSVSTFSLVSNSIKAGHLLPHLKYQLYAKQKSTLFPGITLHQTLEVAGTSQSSLQPNVRQKLHLPQQKIGLSVPHTGPSLLSCRNNHIPPSSCSSPQPTQHSIGHSIVGQIITDSKHRGPLQSHPPQNLNHTKPPHKSTHRKEEEKIAMWVFWLNFDCIVLPLKIQGVSANLLTCFIPHQKWYTADLIGCYEPFKDKQNARVCERRSLFARGF